jgi:transposase
MLVKKQEVHMPQTRPPYPPEFRQQIVALVKTGRSIASLSKEFGLSEQSIRNWRKQADLDFGARSDGLTTAERDELRRLRQENRRLQQERDILAKAAAWFARETGSIPSSSS